MSEMCLSQLLQLEKIEKGIYRGQSWDLGFKALFGGQVMGQALAAAQNTVEMSSVVHSYHSYFLLPGDAEKPVVYTVENLRDGRSFSSRRVKAVQHGRIIFSMVASFQIPEEGFTHQHVIMPDVPHPDELSNQMDTLQLKFDKLPQTVQEKIKYHEPLEKRVVQVRDENESDTVSASQYVWMRVKEPLKEDLNLNQSLLAYASDYYFLMTAVQPHRKNVVNKSLQVASIDHALWFHRRFNFNEWILYCMESPVAGGARGLVRGQLFNEKGELIASAVQEGLIRQIKRDNS
jgi:acyl-CoA thioesterase-2